MRRGSAISAAAIATLVAVCVSGCVASGAVSGAPATAVPVPSSSAPAESDIALACAQLTAPISLVQNTALAPDGALSKASEGGLYFTANWEFDRIQAIVIGSELEAPVEALEQASGAMNVALQATDDPAKWADHLAKISAATQEVNAACTAIDSGWGTIGWYGG
jgi:hypothetical protein